jgi:hypothetical protein
MEVDWPRLRGAARLDFHVLPRRTREKLARRLGVATGIALECLRLRVDRAERDDLVTH